MPAHTRTCCSCGRTGTCGFSVVGHRFVLRGRTRTAQRLNQRSGPAVWQCARGVGCRQRDAYLSATQHRALQAVYVGAGHPWWTAGAYATGARRHTLGSLARLGLVAYDSEAAGWVLTDDGRRWLWLYAPQQKAATP